MCTRRLKIKKLIFSTAVILSAFLLLTCDIFSPNENSPQSVDRPQYTSTDNGSYTVTVYLDGSPPVYSISSRALTKELAIVGHDLFEVTFHHPDSNRTARAAWERGHAAGVTGVVRNIDYGYVNTAAVPNINSGAAILFVGKRSDKTLLGVGRLTGVNNGDGLGTVDATLVTSDTVSVVFTVSALKAGASRSTNKGASSFFTPDLAGTSIIEVYVGSRIFPLYNIARNQSRSATYTLGVNTASPYDFAYYNAGILRGGAATLVQNDVVQYPIYDAGPKLQPRYPRGDGTHGLPTSFTADANGTGTTIALTNNQGGTALANPVQFTFNTNGTANSSIFSFAFEIPVYPLTNADGRGNDNYWYIRPGFDSYIRDIDDGIGGTGGAILIGVGDIDQSLIFSFFVGTPFKTRYYNTNIDTSPGATPVGPGNPEPLPALNDYVFNLTGLELAIRAGGVPIRGVSINAASYFLEEQLAPATGLIPVLPNDNLFNTIFLTDGTLPMGIPTYGSDGRIQINPAFLTYIQNDMIKVRVEYFDADTQALGDDPYYGFFYVYLSDPGGLGPIPPLDNIPSGNRLVIMNWLDLTLAAGTIEAAGSGTFLLVLYDSMDFPSINLNGGPYLFIILAAQPNLTFGKENNGGFTNWATGNTYYYGIWPYDDTELIIFGQAVNSQPFRLNAAGSYLTIDSGVRDYPTQWFMRNPNYAPPDSIVMIVNTGAVDVVHPQNFTQVNTVNPPP